ncbi:MAG: MucR family transcriptional regulator [Rhodospirillaceae bacterium]
MDTPDNSDITSLTARIVAAYVSHHQLPVSELPRLIQSVRDSLQRLTAPAEEAPAKEELKPAVPIKKSVTPDYIICLEDGKKLKMLKRHLMSSYGITPDEYRAKWGLPTDYPMVAPNYAKARSDLAVKLGLGRRSGDSEG